MHSIVLFDLYHHHYKFLAINTHFNHSQLQSTATNSKTHHHQIQKQVQPIIELTMFYPSSTRNFYDNLRNAQTIGPQPFGMRTWSYYQENYYDSDCSSYLESEESGAESQELDDSDSEGDNGSGSDDPTKNDRGQLESDDEETSSSDSGEESDDSWKYGYQMGPRWEFGEDSDASTPARERLDFEEPDTEDSGETTTDDSEGSDTDDSQSVANSAELMEMDVEREQLYFDGQDTDESADEDCGPDLHNQFFEEPLYDSDSGCELGELESDKEADYHPVYTTLRRRRFPTSGTLSSHVAGPSELASTSPFEGAPSLPPIPMDDDDTEDDEDLFTQSYHEAIKENRGYNETRW